MNYVKFEDYKKVGLIFLLTIFSAASILPAIHFLSEYINEPKSEYLFISIPIFIIGIIILRQLMLVLKNYNIIYYFKISDKQLEHLRIYNQTAYSKDAVLKRMNSIYFKPQYSTISFSNIKKFETGNGNQIHILYNDGSRITIPIHLSESKLKESNSTLNTKLNHF